MYKVGDIVVWQVGSATLGTVEKAIDDRVWVRWPGGNCFPYTKDDSRIKIKDLYDEGFDEDFDV